MKLKSSKTMVMANHHNLLEHLNSKLSLEFSKGHVNLTTLRNLVSSPRLISISARAFSHPALFPGGDTYLDSKTMLAAPAQGTFVLPISEFEKIQSTLEIVNEYHFTDTSAIQIQAWPFDARTLNEFQLTIAVALSYTPAELAADSRISLAIDEAVSKWGFFTDDF